MKRKDLKILWMSNAPFAPTGYGTVTKNVCYRLKELGYNVAVVNFYGVEGALLNLNKLRIYPNMQSNPTDYGKMAAKFAIADFQPNIFITLFDIWVGYGWLDRVHPYWCPYTPIDHYPVPPPVAEIARKAYQVISMSSYGYVQLEKQGIHSVCIPHGVDTKTYFPMENKQACKVWLNHFSKNDQFSKHENAEELNEFDFIVGVNGANKARRKDFPRMFRAFKHFLEQNPDAKKDAKLYLHTFIRGMMDASFHLDDLLRDLELLPYVRWTPLLKMYCGVAEDQLNVVYNAFDVFLNPSQGEGFGIPIIEAQACGVPCIVTDFTSMTELVQEHGWLVPIADLHYTPLNAMQCNADEYKIAEAIGEAYNSAEKTELYGKTSLENAQKNYDYEKVIIPKWVDFLDTILLEHSTVCELKEVIKAL